MTSWFKEAPHLLLMIISFEPDDSEPARPLATHDTTDSQYALQTWLRVITDQDQSVGDKNKMLHLRLY